MPEPVDGGGSEQLIVDKGIVGFAYGTALSGLPPLIYYWWQQRRSGYLMAKYELYEVVAFMGGIAVFSFASSSLVLTWWHVGRVRLR